MEVDGGYHAANEVVAYDAERARYLEALGFRVVRFSNRAVLQDVEGVVGEIAAAAMA